MRVEIIWRCSLVMTVAMLSLVSCSSNDGEQEKPFTVCPVEQTKFFVCEASGETRGATAVIDTFFTEDDIEWFNVSTREIRFKKQDEQLFKKLMKNYHKEGLEFRLGENFSFEGEFAGDYPACLDGGPALTTIEAMVPTRIIRVSGEQLVKRFSQDKKSMDLRCLIAEHLLSQARVRYTDLHRATPLERYELLLRRCPGIARHLPLNAIASFLCVTPQQLSRIRKAVTFSEK